jgi:ElaB/YqjD/DUF883 family membrane-anchored ribosome-binding protein
MAAVNPLPPPDDAVEQDLIEAEREIRTAIDRAGLRDDPYAAVLLAAASFLSVLRGVRAEYRSEIANAITEVRLPISVDEMNRLALSASEGALQASTKLARAHNWRTLAIATIAAVGLLAGGYFFAHAQDRWVGVQLGLESLEVSAASASAALVLLKYNDLGKALHDCTPAPQTNGEPACTMTVWTSPRESAKAVR